MLSTLLLTVAVAQAALAYPYPAGGGDKCDVHCATAGYMMAKTTVPNESAACTQGCALLTMYQLDTNSRVFDHTAATTDGQPSPKDRCASACNAAWSGQSSLIEACAVGCRAEKVMSSPGGVSVSLDSNSPLYPYAQKAMSQQFSGFDGMFDSFRNALPHWPVRPMHGRHGGGGMFGGDGHDMMPHGGMMDMGPHHMMMHDHQPMLMLEPPAWQNEPDAWKWHESAGGGGGDRFADSVRAMHGNMMRALKQALGYKQPRDGEDKEDVRYKQIQPVTQGGASERHANTLDSVRAFEPSPPVDRMAKHILIQMPSADREHYERHQSWLSCLRARARHLNAVTRWTVCMALTLCAASLALICVALLRRRTTFYHQYYGGQPNGPHGGVKTVSGAVSAVGEEKKVPLVDSTSAVWEPNPPPTPPVHAKKAHGQGTETAGGPPPAYDDSLSVKADDKADDKDKEVAA